MILHATIIGRVQGVGFRAWVADEARRRGLSGWVRNRRDGSVEAIFAGEPDTVDAMVASCREGPSSARVRNVVVEPGSDDLLRLAQRDAAFSVLPTA